MNKTFKVVFNKARGVMTVVNEATSSVQAKGCKAVVAATCVLAASCATAAEGSSAADVTPIQSSGAFINGTEFNIIDSAKESIQIEASEHEGYLKITAKDFVGEQDHATPYPPLQVPSRVSAKRGNPVVY